MRLENDDAVDGRISQSPSVSTNLDSLEEETIESKNEKDFVLSLKRNFIELTLKANGKADLYFHAYLWHLYILNLYLKAHPSSTEAEFE